MNEYVNPFYVLAVKEETGELPGVSQLFGIPCGFTADRWPEVSKTKYNHILTVEIKDLRLPINNNISTLSIFYRSSNMYGEGGNPVEVVLSTEFDLESGRMDDYPPGHIPWWDDQDSMALLYDEGLAIELFQQEIPKDIIEGMLLDDKNVIPDYDVINKFADDQSYIGGFPVWFQDEETPLSVNGKRTHFVLAMNGYNKYFERSPFASQVSYLFFDDFGNPYWVVQS